MENITSPTGLAQIFISGQIRSRKTFFEICEAIEGGWCYPGLGKNSWDTTVEEFVIWCSETAKKWIHLSNEDALHGWFPSLEEACVNLRLPFMRTTESMANGEGECLVYPGRGTTTYSFLGNGTDPYPLIQFDQIQGWMKNGQIGNGFKKVDKLIRACQQGVSIDPKLLARLKKELEIP